MGSIRFAILMTNWALCCTRETMFISLTVDCQNLAVYNYFLVEKSLVAYVIYWGQNKHIQKTYECCWCKCSCNVFCLQLHDCHNFQFSHPIHCLSLKDLHKCIPPSRLHQYVNLNVNLLDCFKLQVNHFGHCPYHPNVLVNFTLLAQHFIIFIILLIICILCIL